MWKRRHQRTSLRIERQDRRRNEKRHELYRKSHQNDSRGRCDYGLVIRYDFNQPLIGVIARLTGLRAEAANKTHQCQPSTLHATAYGSRLAVMMVFQPCGNVPECGWLPSEGDEKEAVYLCLSPRREKREREGPRLLSAYCTESTDQSRAVWPQAERLTISYKFTT
jgi:hypothetical protein